MISPRYKYTRNEDFRREKIERKEGSIKKLEGLISQTMKENYQKNIAETLEDEKPILYIDCSEKEDLDIMFFILKEYEKNSTLENKSQILANIIKKRTMILEPEQREEYIKTQQPNSKEMLTHYRQLLQKKLTELQPDHIQYILNCENDIAITGLATFMKEEDKSHIYLYVDNTKNLSVDEQTRINLLLYARGGIDHSKWIHLKINNGNSARKTRTASNGHRVESTHDYSEIDIKEEDLDPSI
ncbi:MAG: hypothetical protein WCO66_03670 [Candidatus Absconditabacteria bacterium]